MNKNIKAFTLVELMVVVAIIGILASVAGSAYYKYILKSRSAGAPLLIKSIYDAEVVFASKNSVSYRDETYGDVTCRPSPRFVSACMHKRGPLSGAMPGTRKTEIAFYHMITQPSSYEQTTHHCVMNAVYGHPKFLGFMHDQNVAGGNASLTYQSLDIDSYFILRARRDNSLVNEYGAILNDTLMIAALGDLDGDHDVSESTSCSNTSPSAAHFGYKSLSIYARGMYIDSEGEVQGTQMITINPLE